MAETRTIGRSDLETPPLILGGNVFGWTADKATSFAVLDAFVAGGGRMIDTADVYSAWVDGHEGGESETVIGEWLRRRGRRDDVMITTKVGMLPIGDGKGLAPSHIAAAIDASLRRLGTDYVDLYLSHRDDPSQDLGDVAEAFDAAVKAGKVRVVGASNFTVDRLSAAIEAQDAKGAARYEALQNQYNLLERGEYEGALQDYCVAHDIGMTPYYGLARGYLSGKYRSAGDLKGTRSGGVKTYLEGDGPRVLAALDQVAEATGAIQAQIALAWIAARLGAMELTLDRDQLDARDAASAATETA